MLVLSTCRIHLTDEGSGPPVLFLHGNPDSPHLWNGIIRHLKNDFRCIAPELPGFGRSEVDDGIDYTLDGQARYVEELLQALQIREPVYLVGHDFGGIFALAWATRQKNRVVRIALMNTVFHADYRGHFWAHVWRTPVLGEISMAAMNRPLFRHALRRGSPRLPLDYIDATFAGLTPSVKRSILRLYRSVGFSSLKEREHALEKLGVDSPMLVLWGEGDPYIPSSFASRFPARKVVMYRGAGHWLPVVEAQAVAGEIKAFFSRRDLSPV